MGVVGSSHKVEVAKRCGCDYVIDKSSTENWEEEALVIAEKLSAAKVCS